MKDVRCLIAGGTRRGVPVTKHLVKCCVPFVGEAFCQLLSFVLVWHPATPHLWEGCFALSVGLDHGTGQLLGCGLVCLLGYKIGHLLVTHLRQD